MRADEDERITGMTGTTRKTRTTGTARTADAEKTKKPFRLDKFFGFLTIAAILLYGAMIYMDYMGVSITGIIEYMK